MNFLKKYLRISKKNSPRKVAGVLIDMQECYLRYHTLAKRKVLIRSQYQTIDFLSKNNSPIAVLEFVKDDGRTLTIPELETKIEDILHEYFPKEDTSGFTNPDLLTRLREWEVEHLILMGINSSFCVKYTAIDALKQGFSISTSKDLISDSQYFLHPEKWFKRNCFYYTNTVQDLLKKLQ